MTRKFELWDSKEKNGVQVRARKVGKEWIGYCPKHNDQKASLCINEEKRVFYCQGCGWRGKFWDPDYEKRNKQREVIATYDYRDEKGRVLYQVVRFSPKTFRQRRPDGKGGWTWDLKGIERVLYKLPDLIQGADPVFIVEGEKDVENLRAWKLTATTCPMGVKKWKPQYTKYLQNRDVVLIPDNDKQGKEHMEDIATQLFGKTKAIKYLELPDLEVNEDFTDWMRRGGTKEKLLKFVKEAPEFDPTRPVYQQNGAYLKRGKGPITNFIILPKVRIQIDSQEHLKADIATQKRKKYQNVQFNPDSWISKHNFKKALGGLLDVEYKGTEDDIQDIKGILASRNPPIKQGVKTTGLHQIDRKWLYVEGELSWDKDGPREDVIHLSENPYTVALLKQKPLTFANLDELLAHLFNFNSEDVVYPLLGFCFSCFIKERILPMTNQNPILVTWGEKDSGKTATLSKIIKPLFAIQAPLENIGHPTEFGFARIISSSNLAPILFDEHKAEKISQVQNDRISEMLRSVYNQTRLTRGTPSLGIVEFIYSAPVVVSGEIGMTELSIKDRIVETYFSKKKIEDKKEIFKKLTKCALGSLGRDFLLWTLSLNDKKIKETWLEQLEAVDKELKDRLRENTAHARLGLTLFSQYLESREKEPIHRDILAIIDETQKKNILEDTNKSIVDSIIEVFALMAEEGILEEGKHFKVDSNLRLGLYLSGIYPLFKRWVNDYKWDGEVLDRNSFLKQLKEAGYFLKTATIRLRGKIRWGPYLDLLKMDHLEIEGFKE